MSKKENKPLPQLVERAANSALASITYQASTQLSQGPLPSPEILKHYNSVIPGLADRIVAMAEAEAAHRREIEKKIIETQASDMARFRRAELCGQIFGLLIGLTALIGAVYAAVNHAQVAASFIGTTGVTGLVTAFIIGRQSLVAHQKKQAEQVSRKPEQTDHQ